MGINVLIFRAAKEISIEFKRKKKPEKSRRQIPMKAIVR